MHFDANVAPASLQDVPALARGAERLGFDAIWSSETQHNPFLPLAIVASQTQRLRFGTAVAIAFARSPADLAYTAWDLSAASGGRFILGLGTQVRAHIERRFGMSWPDSPVGKLRDLVAAIRAIWTAWQTGERLNFRGTHYKLTLMTPFFDPGPIEHPEIPIYLAGVNPGLCRLAGEIANGFHAHPLHSPRYLRQVVKPAIASGAASAQRPPESVALSASAFVVTDEEEKAFVKDQIAFYASTPTYRGVLALHGWEETGKRLSALARRGAWSDMASLIGDDMLEAFAVVSDRDGLAAALRRRYEDLVDRLNIYLEYRPGDRDEFWQRLMSGMGA